jgi:hypothetical protein
VNKAQALRLIFSPAPLFPLDGEDLAELPRGFHDLPGEMPTSSAQFFDLIKDTRPVYGDEQAHVEEPAE